MGSRGDDALTRLPAALLLIGCLLLAVVIGLAHADARVDAGPADPAPLSCDGKPADHHAHRALTVAESAYAKARWQDPSPATDSEKRRWREHKRCLLDDDRRARVAEQIDRLRERFERYREQRQITPFYGEGRWWAIPFYIVACETQGYSGRERYSALNESSGAGGAYQVVPSTWQTYGGSGSPHLAAPREQDEIAHRIYAAEGSDPWSCA